MSLIDSAETVTCVCDDPVELAALHAKCFSQPWSPETFSGLLNVPGCVSLITRSCTSSYGFVLARQAADEVEILTIGAVPANRRAGVGQALFIALLSELRNASTVFIEVDILNPGAIAFYVSLGFHKIGERKNYYAHSDGTKSDAITMALQVP